MSFIEITGCTTSELKEQVVLLLVEQMLIVKGRDEKSAPSKDDLQGHVMKAMDHILDETSPAHLFALVEKDRALAVSLVNMACGVESGGKYLWLNEIYVPPEARRKGLGKQMATHIIEWARKNDCRYMAGITWEANSASQGLFKKCGFDVEQVLWLDRTL